MRVTYANPFHKNPTAILLLPAQIRVDPISQLGTRRSHTHKMSWFGGGSQKEEREKSFASTDTDGFDAGDNMLSLGGSDNGGGASEFQQFSMGLQQQLIIQQVITDLSDKAFLKCVSSTRDGQLSGKEVSCIYAATNKWLDTNDFMGGRLAKKSQQQQQGQYQ